MLRLLHFIYMYVMLGLMARNEEKHVTRLNRLLLQQQRDEELKKNPPRPKLYTLNSAEEIKKWLPSLKKDIDFNLKQSQVACYPERKISEFSQEIERLKREYQAFVRKLRQFDPSLGAVPWTERAYSTRKRPCTELKDDVDADKPVVKLQDLESTGSYETPLTESSPWCDSSALKKEVRKPTTSEFTLLSTPVLDQEARFTTLYGYRKYQPEISWNVDAELADKPLNFCVKPEISTCAVDKNINAADQTDSHSQVNHANTARTGNQCTQAHQSSNLTDSYQREKVIDSQTCNVNSTTKGSLQTLMDTYGAESDEDDDDFNGHNK